MKITEGSIVELAYTLAEEGGEVIESSEQEGPLIYLHGNEELPERLEQALAGAGVGTKLELTLTPEEHVGPYDVNLITTVPRSDFPADEEIEVGAWISVDVELDEEEDGESGEFELDMRVVEINDDAIVLDGNSPLAGKTLRYAVEVLAVREPTEEDLELRHEHGEGCGCD
ncbi:MAG: peptidylprolyl isomerase [Planctomycetes bacterium]|nr:peptidylprolyl isomerase [Planctomycetota bacterium]